MLAPAARLLKTASATITMQACAVREPAQGQFVLEAEFVSARPQPVVDALFELATSGIQADVYPLARDRIGVALEAGAGIDRGVRVVGVSSVTSSFGPDVGKKSMKELRELTRRLVGGFDPIRMAGQFEDLGYRTELTVPAANQVQVRFTVGRLLRRIRVFGALPLSERDVRRSLSVRTRPGELSFGQCVSTRRARDKALKSTCDPSDVRCKQWEDSERRRVRRFLFDNGYLQGEARLLLVCGRDKGEADLHVYVKHGRPLIYRPRDMTVTGVEDRLDARWIKRAYTPRVLGVIPKRITRDFMEKAQQRVVSTFASSSTYGRLVRASSLDVYPRVSVTSSFERYDTRVPGSIPREKNPPLDIDISLGRPLKVAYQNAADLEGPLTFSPRTLNKNLNIFATGEQVSLQTARREAANLRSFYQSRGYPLASIRGAFSQGLEADLVEFSVTEGPKGTIRESTLVAPRAVPPLVHEDVRAQWRASRSLRRGGTFSEQASLDDLKTILGAYAAAGYLCAQAQLQLAFWPDGFDSPQTYVRLGLNDLLKGGGQAAWAAQLDALGMESLRQSATLDLYTRITIRPGPRMFTARSEEVRYLSAQIPSDRTTAGLATTDEGNWGATRIFETTPLRGTRRDGPGDVPITPTLDNQAEEAIVEKYRNNGYPLADAELNWIYGRDSGPVTMSTPQDFVERGYCKEQRSALVVQLQPSLTVHEGPRGVFGRTAFRGNFKTRTWVLSRELDYNAGDPFDQSKVNDSLGAMQATQTIAEVRVTPYQTGCDDDDDSTACTIHQVIAIDEAKDITAAFSFGFGAQTLNPLYVFLRPKFPNLFGTAIDLEMEALWGFPLTDLLSSTDLCGGLECFERRASATLIRNRIFGTRANLEVTGQFSRRVTPARGRVDAAFGQLRFTWRVGERANMYAGYLVQLANLSKDSVRPLGGGTGDFVSRRDAVVSDRTGALETGYAWTNTDNAFNPSEGVIASVALRLASPLLAGQDWWYSHDFTFQHFIPIPRTSDRLNFRYSLRYGEAFPFKGPYAATTTVPEVWRFYGGGTADLGLRGILPETMYVDIEEIPNSAGGVIYRPRAIGGHIRAIGTLALQVTSLKSFLGGRLAHSIFYDFGVIGQRWRQIDLVRDYRQSIGINALKWDVNVVTLALGYAILVPTASNVRQTDDRNGRVVFDVGVTF